MLANLDDVAKAHACVDTVIGPLVARVSGSVHAAVGRPVRLA